MGSGLETDPDTRNARTRLRERHGAETVPVHADPLQSPKTKQWLIVGWQWNFRLTATVSIAIEVVHELAKLFQL